MADDDENNYSAGGQYNRGAAPPPLTDFDRDSRDIFLWGDLSGAKSRGDRNDAARTAQANRQYWDLLHPPTADQLSGSQTSRDAQRQALAQLQQWGQGGLTSTDQAGLETQRQRDAMGARSQQQALQQQAQARGVGGSGLDFATRQMASQQGQTQASDAESQMLQGAQQRALQSIQASGQLGSQMRQQDSSAVSGAYDAATQRAAGATGQYGTDAGTNAANRNRQDDEQNGILGGIGTLIAAI